MWQPPAVDAAPITEPPPAVDAAPITEPTIEPTVEPTIEPTVEPISEPTVEPISEPTAKRKRTEPTKKPTNKRTKLSGPCSLCPTVGTYPTTNLHHFSFFDAQVLSFFLFPYGQLA